MKVVRGSSFIVGIVTLAVGISSSDAEAQRSFSRVKFKNVSAEVGIGGYTMAQGMGAGLLASDFDDDGDVDVFIPQGQSNPDLLYRNLGDGTFEEVAGVLGVSGSQDNRLGLWLDCDGDGRLDLLTANDDAALPSNFQMYAQESDGTFTNVTTSSGLDLAHGAMHMGGMAAGDINNDGFLDVYIGVWRGAPGSGAVGDPFLFENNGDGTFTDITLTSGIDASNRPSHFQPIFADFNNDGWQDIYVNVDFTENMLLINQQDGTFVDMAIPAGAHNTMNDMGLTIGDYDNDGDWDLFCTNVYDGLTEWNVLYENTTVGATLSFTDRSWDLGTEYGGWGWGTTFLDFDNDGYLDIAATNGWHAGAYPTDRSRLFKGTGGDRFVEVSAVSRFNDADWGSALVKFDYDHDGDLDLMQTCNVNGPVRLFANQGTSGNYLLVKPRTLSSNPRAIGAVIKATCGAVQRMRLITAGTSFMSQEPAESFFGLNNAEYVDSLRVEFPDGSVSELDGIATNQVITVAPPPLVAAQVRIGDITNGNVLSMVGSDNGRFGLIGETGVQGSPQGSDQWAWSRVDVHTESSVVSHSTLDLQIESSVTYEGVFTVVKLYNWNTGRFDFVGVHQETRQTDSVFNYNGISTTDYVDAQGRTIIRLTTRRESASGNPFRVRFDQLSVTLQ
jgi:hypothetical protein